MNFTKDQQNAIDIRDKNVLVSAAAGSGKTAVLVERIIRRVTDEKEPLDVDRILVMTFTKAAAAQMRERILDAIEELREKRPHDKNLQKQAALVHNAHIQTIDSFCLNVVRDHFHEADLQPDLRIADEGELKMIEQDVIERVLEEAYEEGDEDFLTMTESLSAKKTDEGIEDIIKELREFADSHPDPAGWLKSFAKAYETADTEKVTEMPWMEERYRDLIKSLESVRKRLSALRPLCLEENGPLGYEEAIDADLKLTEDLLKARDYGELYEKLKGEGFDAYKFKSISMKSRIPKITDDTDAKEADLIRERNRLKDYVKGGRDNCRDELKAILTEHKFFSPENICRVMKKAYPSVNALIKLALCHMEVFNSEKALRNVASFNDIEHFCLDILKKGDGSTAKDLREYFEEIYVDEYQDSNLLQEEILRHISRKTENCGNVFMVGDVKQSIYGFRQACPMIFTGKYDSFTPFKERTDDSRDVRIDLSHNFRSRDSVIRSINEIFKRIMTKDIGGIVYDDAAALHTGAEYPEYPVNTMNAADNDKTELLLAIRDDETDDKLLEAKAVANRIKRLMEQHKVTVRNEDEKSRETSFSYRKLRYSDIVILLRTVKDWDTVFAKTLDAEGIPAHVMSSKGYFSAKEVGDLLSYLSIIDNPLQDIALASALLSPLCGFSDDELARIRAFKRNEDMSLFESVSIFASDPLAPDELKMKCAAFLEKLNSYREISAYTPVYELISLIIDSGYGAIVSAMPGGRQRMANLNMLLKKAVDYGKTSYKGLFHFNRYIEALQRYDIDFGEASLLSENDDTVRIMSIHKSKGLEFPVCILAGMGKSINYRDSRSSIVTDADLGIGVDFIDPRMRTKEPTFYKKLISEKKKRETLAEEMRLFYVALTRAEEKLIMSGVIKNGNELYIEGKSLTKASSYLDLYKSAASGQAMEDSAAVFVSAEDLIEDKIKERVDLEADRIALEKFLEEGERAGNKLLFKEIKDRFNYKYPYTESPGQYTKISVTELKRRSMDSRLKEDYKGADEGYDLYGEDAHTSGGKRAGSDNDRAARHGTAVHRVFELWDYGRPCDKDSVSAFIDEIRRDKRIEEDLAGLIGADEIHAFVNSDIAARMQKADSAGSLRREQPFVIETDGMLVQGIIDAYFIEEGEIVVVDYKTDRVSDADVLRERYRIQLDYYALALSRLTGLKVKEKLIWSACLNKEIKL